MILVGVNAAVREQAEEMQLASAFAGALQGSEDGGVGEELAARDQRVDASNVHADDAARADIEMAHFAVAHLPVRQTDEVVGGMEKRVGEFRQQLVVGRLAGQRNCVVLNLRAVSPSIEDRQDDGS